MRRKKLAVHTWTGIMVYNDIKLYRSKGSQKNRTDSHIHIRSTSATYSGSAWSDIPARTPLSEINNRHSTDNDGSIHRRDASEELGHADMTLKKFRPAIFSMSSSV